MNSPGLGSIFAGEIVAPVTRSATAPQVISKNVRRFRGSARSRLCQACLL
jgi:hypothetical protein